MNHNERSDIRARLWGSLEMAHVRMQLIVWAVGYAVTLAACCFNDSGIPQVAAMMAVFVSVMFVPILGFWLWRIFRIFQSVEEYIFCRTELSQPHHMPMLRGMFTFMGIIEDNGSRFAVETHAIFAERGIIPPLMEDYVGKTVTICWNRETEMVVVIG